MISIFCAINYKLNPIVIRQLANRFPLFYPHFWDIPIVTELVINNCITSVYILVILVQLYKLRETRHIHQGVSSILKLFLTVCFVFCCFTLICSTYNLSKKRDSGRFGVYMLDCFNYLWVIGNMFQIVAFWPQICINWMGQCCNGISGSFINLMVISSLIKLLAFALQPDKEFYQQPFNLEPLFVICMELIALLVILSQSLYIYSGNRPKLPKISDINRISIA